LPARRPDADPKHLFSRRALTSLALAVATAWATLSPEPASAWDAARTGRGDPVRWFARDQPVSFRIGATDPAELPIEVVSAVVQTAWGTWHGAGCDGVPGAVYRGRSDAIGATRPESLRAEPDNVVVFVSTAAQWSALGRGESEIAVTLVSNNERTGEIVDADILVNDGHWRLTLTASAGAVAGEVDFASAMTHEVGHALGLLHSADTSATMYATYSGVEPAGARTLAEDDRVGLCEHYAGVPAHVEGALVEHCVGTPGPLPWITIAALVGLVRRGRRGHGARGEAGPGARRSV